MKIIEYIIKIDKNGKEYALKLNLKSGKYTRVKIEYAKKREKKLKYEREVRKIKLTDEYKQIIKEIEFQGWGGSFFDHQRHKKRLIKEIRIDAEKRNLKKSEKEINNQAHKAAFRFVGFKIITRYYFKYWETGYICEYTDIEQGYYDNQFMGINKNKYFNIEVKDLKIHINKLISTNFFYYTESRDYILDGVESTQGINSGSVVMVSRGYNKIIKEYHIPKKTIKDNTVICLDNGKVLFRNKILTIDQLEDL